MKKKTQAMWKMIKKDREGRIALDKTHKPSVSELVYRYLEKASNREVTRMQKNNATNQFRKFHRRKYSKTLGQICAIKSLNKKKKLKAYKSVFCKPQAFPHSKITPIEGSRRNKVLFRFRTNLDSERVIVY
jgi:hypothetical protein